MKKIILSILFIFTIFVSGFGQSLKGLVEYNCFVSYGSDEAFELKECLPIKNFIETWITFNIPRLKNLKQDILDYYYKRTQAPQIFITFNFYKNYQESFIQYYGSVEMKVARDISVTGSNDIISAFIYNDQSYFIMNSPSCEGIRNESQQMILNLLTAFGKNYYEQN